MDNLPDWVSSITLPSDIEGKSIQYLLCQNEASLIYMVNLGAIEINPWISHVGHLDNPDYMIIDLDPLECPFSHVIATAKAVHEILSEINTPHYIKTSGVTGLHINVPLGTLYTYEQARQFSMLICTLVNRHLPKITSMERMPEKRVGKVYLDYLQNIKGKTMAAPYCLRPKAGAPVSTPLLWEELRDNLRIENFTMHTIVDRLEAIGEYSKTSSVFIYKAICWRFFVPKITYTVRFHYGTESFEELIKKVIYEKLTYYSMMEENKSKVKLCKDNQSNDINFDEDKR
jgi:bifunctional non-homologous end joining protein LigD